MRRTCHICALLLILCLLACLVCGCSPEDPASSSLGEPALSASELVVCVYDSAFVTLLNGTGAVNDWHIAQGSECVRMEQTGNDTVQLVGSREGEAVLHCEYQDGERTVMLVCRITVVPRSFTLNLSTFVLQYGQALNLFTYPTFNSAIVWESSDTNVVVVDAAGKVTAVGVGVATVTASIEKKPEINASASVTVTEASNVTSVMTMVPSLLETEVGGTVTLSASGGTGTYTWTSSDPEKATVTANGIVTAITTGKVKVTATDTNGNTAVCNISIYRAPTSITVSPATANLSVGKTQKFTANVYPADASNNIIWYSSDTSVAKVSASGLVTVLKPGTVTITAKSAYNSIKASATVTTGIKVTGISVDKANLTAGVGEIFKINAVIAPQNAAIKSYSVSISDTNIVKQNGDTFVAVAPGTATLTFKSDDGGFTAKTEVTVKSAVTAARIDPNICDVGAGSTAQLSIIPTPADADVTGTWKSGDTAVVTIDEKGVVTGVAPGVATITFTFKSGLSVTSVVRVVSGVGLDSSELELAVGKTHALKVVGKDGLLGQWTSDKPEIATVSEDGTVTAVAMGSAVITFTPGDSTYSPLTCAVTVYAATEKVTVDATDVYLQKDAVHTPVFTISPSTAKQTGTLIIKQGADVISLSETGTVTALKEGAAVLEHTTVDGIVTCVNVYVGKRVTGVSFEKSEQAFALGNFLALSPVFAPADAANKNGVYTSSDENVLTVDEKGVLTPILPGTAIVTFLSDDGGFASSVTVTVTQKSDRALTATINSQVVPSETETVIQTGITDILPVLTPAVSGVEYSVLLLQPVEGVSAEIVEGKVRITALVACKTTAVIYAKAGTDVYALIVKLDVQGPTLTPTPAPTPTVAPSATPAASVSPAPAAV